MKIMRLREPVRAGSSTFRISFSVTLIILTLLLHAVPSTTRAAGTPQTTRRTAGTEPSGPAAITRRVPAAQPWTATGIHLSSGQRVTISADGSIITNLNGVAATPSGTNPDCGVAGPVRIPFVAPQLPCWSLTGRVGRSGEAFEVGAKMIFTSGAAGELYLGVNDNFFGDNSGAWSATITTGPPSVTSAVKPAPQPPVASEAECLGSDREGIRNNIHGTVRIVQGTGAFESITPENKLLAVSPGEMLQGTVTLTALNNGPGFAVAVMVETPSWGDPATSWRPLGNLPTGEVTRTAKINVQAPLQPGIYHILFAFQLELSSGNVASGTNWSTRGDVWNDGNDLAEFNPTQIHDAQSWGCTVDAWLMPEGPQLFYVPADAITVEVK